MSEAKADATIACWFTTIGSDGEDGYTSVFSGTRHLLIDTQGLPLPSPLPAEALDALRSQGIPEGVIRNGVLDFEWLVANGWTASSVVPTGRA